VIREREETSADVASTGGPGSLTTLITNPVLVAMGFTVPKIGVPGRPAGGIDSLGSLPGFRVDLDPDAFESVMRAVGHAHVRASEHWAPADAELFALRQEVGAQAVVELAAASLLSKKVAAGLSRVVLDVRVAPHGNFGTTLETAEAAGSLFAQAALLLGIQATAVLSDSAGPQQPFLGRGESLQALHQLLTGTASGALLNHLQDCVQLVDCISPLTIQEDWAESAFDSFCQHLQAQGCAPDSWLERAERIAGAERLQLAAESAGRFILDMAALRAVIVEANTRTPTGGAAFADEAGVRLLAMPGDLVSEGQPLAAVRSTGDLPAVVARVGTTLSVRPGSDPSDAKAEWHGRRVSAASP
jgi:thymidine phosphorylase